MGQRHSWPLLVTLCVEPGEVTRSPGEPHCPPCAGGPRGESGALPGAARGVRVPQLPGRHSASPCAILSEQIPSYAEENGEGGNRTRLKEMWF